jgi:Ser/Thr protein kinase RdoA (MazF antagonist)
VQIERRLLGDGHVQAAGECLARIHAAFHTFPAERVRAKNLTVDAAAVLTSIPRIESAVEARATMTAVDRSALEQLAGRRDWLAGNVSLAEDIPARLAALPQWVVHGDFQETNLFFEGRIVSAVIDWDQSGLTARGWEIVRSLHLMLALAPAPCRRFLAGYRRVLSLPEGELQGAAACYGVLADNNLWVYEAAYLEDNPRAKRFIVPGPFVPFQRQWAEAGLGV